MGFPHPASTIFAPVSWVWTPNTYVYAGQPQFNAGVLYNTLVAHTTRPTFDATELTYFQTVTASSNVQPGGTSNMTGAVNVDANGADFIIYEGTATGAVTLTTSGYLAAPNRYTVMWFIIHQDATGGRAFTFGDTITWDGANYAPVIPTPAAGTFQFMLYSLDGGVTKKGVCAQPVRTHTIRVGGTLTDALIGKDLEYFDYDARIVKVRPSTGGVPSGAATVFDLKKGSGQGSSTTVYTTTGNRPSVAIGNRTNTATVLPDIVLLAPNDYLAGDCVTASAATNGAVAVKTIEAAV